MNEGMFTIIDAVIAGLLGGGLVSFLMLKANKKEVESRTDLNKAAATEIIRRISKESLEDMEKRLDALDAEAKKKDKSIAKMSSEINALRNAFNRQASQIRYLLDGIRILIQQLSDLKQTPCWKPDDMENWPPMEGLDYDV